MNLNLVTKKLAFRYEENADQNFSFISKKANIYEHSANDFYANAALYKKNSSVYIIVIFSGSKKRKIDSLSLPRILGLVSEGK